MLGGVRSQHNRARKGLVDSKHTGYGLEVMFFVMPSMYVCSISFSFS